MTTSFDFENAQYLTLPNGLRVLVHSNPQSTSSFVSLSVRAGHFYDPTDCHGLAHLLEHMLFMGSRHLSKPNEINAFIEKHGGSINAWTGTEYANYHYQCHGDAIIRTLPAFADMIRQPLLNKEAIANEIQSIDAEFKFKLKDDLRRLYQIHKETCNPEHPFSKFSVGNASTFGVHTTSAIRDKLKSLHSTYYCGENMALCISTPVPFDQIQTLVTQCFSSFDKGQQANTNWPALYTSDNLGVQINIQPLQSARRMIVTFALPGLHNDYKVQPLNYISHLLGDEGEGSLLAYLKSKNWALNLIAGSGIEGDDFKDFNVSFQLTQAGLDNKEEILIALFSYIELIKDAVNDVWRFNEKAKLNTLAIKYEDSVKPLSLVSDFAQHMFMYSPEEVVTLRTIVATYDKKILENALSYFTPQNLRLKVIADQVPTNKACAFYQARYSVEALDSSLLDTLLSPPSCSYLTLPPNNPYLGDNYSRVPIEEKYCVPSAIHSSEFSRFWFAQDDTFESPKGDIYLSFDSNAFSATRADVAAKRIWLSAINDYLQSKYYRAEIAGLHYRLYGHQAGFTLHTRGFTDQQTLLAKQLLEVVQHYHVPKDVFEHHKQLQLQSLHNTLMNKPTNRLFSRLSVLIQRSTQAPIELIDAVEEVSYEDMLKAQESAFKEYFVESFMHGNWTFDQAESFYKDTLPIYQGANIPTLHRSVAKLPIGKSLYHEVICEHDDAAVVLYLQAPSNSLKDTALCMVLEQMLAAPFFNALRTEQQLGYIAGTGYVPHNQHPGMAFYVQSPTHGPKDILDAMTSFLLDQLNEISFYRYYWSTIQHNLLKQLKEQDLSFSMKSQRLWVSLGTQDFTFDRNTQVAHCIETLSFEDIQDYANALAERSHCGELILYAKGKHQGLGDAPENLITNISAFKENTPYY